jgi:hypothetical protein
MTRAHAGYGRRLPRGIGVWRTVAERLARDLYSLRGDGVLRAKEPDGKDHYFNWFEEVNSACLSG